MNMKKLIPTFGVFLISLLIIMLYGCDNKSPEQQTKAIPAIGIENDRLFVGNKEMLAKDFVETYCFAHKDNQTCIEASVLARRQNRKMPPKIPTNW